MPKWWKVSCKIWPPVNRVPVIITDVSVVCCLSVLAVQTKTSKFEIQKQHDLLELEFLLTVYLWHGLNRRALRSFSSISPLSEIWAADLVRSPLRSRSTTPPLLAPLPLHRFFACPLPAPLPLTQFSARSAPFSAPIPLRSHALDTTWLKTRCMFTVRFFILIISRGIRIVEMLSWGMAKKVGKHWPNRRMYRGNIVCSNSLTGRFRLLWLSGHFTILFTLVMWSFPTLQVAL